MKQKKSIRGLLLAAILTFLLIPTAAVALNALPSSSEYVIPVPANAIPVSSFAQLRDEIQAATGPIEILIESDIELTSTITVEQDVIIAAASTAELTVSGNFRHFTVRRPTGGNVRMEFANVELIGRAPDTLEGRTADHAGGGIIIARTEAGPGTVTSTNTIHTLYLHNAIIRNVHNATHGGAIAWTWPQGEPQVFGYQNIVVSGANTVIERSTGTRGAAIAANNVTINDGLFTNNATVVPAGRGGAFYVYSNFTMNGGTVSYNTAARSGGVDVRWGNAVLNGGTITRNTANGPISPQALNGGGGIHVSFGSLTVRNDAEISHNTSYRLGGGVDAGTVIMEGGIIRDNVAATTGGGINTRIFTMSGGIIRDNEAERGGGVYLWGVANVNFPSSFTLSGGYINGNTADSGGGVHLSEHSDLIATGGNIINNAANYNGGGIFAMNYTRLSINSDVVFNGNTAATLHNFFLYPDYVVGGTVAAEYSGGGLGGSTANVTEWGGVSVRGVHVLNNYDINFTGFAYTPTEPSPETGISGMVIWIGIIALNAVGFVVIMKKTNKLA